MDDGDDTLVKVVDSINDVLEENDMSYKVEEHGEVLLLLKEKKELDFVGYDHPVDL